MIRAFEAVGAVRALHVVLQAARRPVAPAPAEDREHWRQLLKRAPSEERHRRHLAAGLMWSSADGYWGLSGNLDPAVTAGLDAAYGAAWDDWTL